MSRKIQKVIACILPLTLLFSFMVPIVSADGYDHDHNYHDCEFDHNHEHDTYIDHDVDISSIIELFSIQDLIKEGYTGRDVKIALLDSGVSDQSITGGFSFIGNEPYDTDSYIHGNHIAEMILSCAKEVELYSLKVLDKDGIGREEGIVEAVSWAIEKEVDIILFGFVMNEYSKALHNKVKAASQRGILLIAPAGNYSSFKPFYPASLSEVISVGAIEGNGRSAYSNYGYYVNTYAEIIQPELQGTSFSAATAATYFVLLYEKSIKEARKVRDSILSRTDTHEFSKGTEESIILAYAAAACSHTMSTATCTAAPKCTKCGYSPTGALGHSYTVVSKAPTCTASGTNKCSRCTATTTTSALGHSGTTATVSATCTASGYTHVKCTRCSVELSRISTTSALGHSYTVVSKAPTCTASGTNKCSRCTATTTTSALGHTGTTATVSATCTASGYTYVKCTRCSTEISRSSTTSALGHSYTVVSKAPTCTASGTNKCSRCTATTTTSALGHTGTTATVSATCTASGYTYIKCTKCSVEISRSGTTSALGHSYTVVSNAPTCTASGTNKCSRCTATTTTSALGHSGTTATVSPTCTASGYTYIKCTKCSVEISRSSTTSALGHSYTVVSNAPTCTASGTNKCSRCTATTTTPALGHSYTISTSPTCTSTGINKCTWCSTTSSIPAYGHDFYGTITDATCQRAGTTKCINCTATKETTPIRSHSYTGTIVNPTCEKNGTQQCIWCPATTLKGVAIGHDFYSTRIDATCQRAETTKCINCTATKETAPIRSHSYTGTIVNPTCEKNGTQQCIWCTATTSIPAYDHDFYGTITDATCQRAGTTKCINCTATKETTPIRSHSYTGTIVDPTCEKNGTQQCIWCPATTLRGTAIGHEFNGMKTDATCQRTETTKCINCAATKETAPIRSHSYTGTTIPATCTVDGSQKCIWCPVVTPLPALNHDNTDATCTAPKTCKRTNCGVTTGSKLEHSFPQTAPCTTKGNVTCTRAGCSATGTASLLTHGSTSTNKVAATCTADGYTSIICINCNTEQYREPGAKATGHVYDLDSYTSLSPTEHEAVCIKCGDVKVESHTASCVFCAAPMTQIFLDETQVDLRLKMRYYIDVDIRPYDPSIQVTWSSSNSNVVSVNQSGDLYAQNEGTAIITASLPNGDFAICRVNVSMMVVDIEIGDIVTFADAYDYIDYPSVYIISGASNCVDVFDNVSLIALTAGEVIVSVFGNETVDYKVRIREQSSLSPIQVLNLSRSVPPKDYAYYYPVDTQKDLKENPHLSLLFYQHYQQVIAPLLGDLPIAWDGQMNNLVSTIGWSPEDKEDIPRFETWMDIMYGHLPSGYSDIPTVIHALLDLMGFVPVVGTLAEGLNAGLYFLEGDIVNGLIRVGAVVVTAVVTYRLFNSLRGIKRIPNSPHAAQMDNSLMVARTSTQSTGRTIPNTLNEKLAMDQVKSAPMNGARHVPIGLSDGRWPATDGWVKMENVVRLSNEKITIHFNHNTITGAFADFKFK